MRTSVRAIAWSGLALWVLGSGATDADALLNARHVACQDAIAKGGVKLVQGQLKLYQRCIEAHLKAGGTATCPAFDAVKLQKLRGKLDADLAKRCTFPTSTPGNLRMLGFPGRCDDADPGDDFTLADLQLCIRTTHEGAITGTCAGGTNARESCSNVSDCPDQAPGTECRSLLRTKYDPAAVGPLTAAGLACQKAVAHASNKYFFAYLKAVHRCRRDLRRCRVDGDGTVTCAVMGIEPAACTTSEPKTVATIVKARAKAEAIIVRECGHDAVAEIHACEPDQPTGATAASCVLDAHQAVAEHLIAIEFPEPPSCGDDEVNRPSEECDGASDAACPGACGTPDGFLPCLCTDGSQQRRQRVVVHAGGDLDLGWTGIDHDSRLAGGGGYLADLWDCDGPAGPDTLCTVGPSCSDPPHAPCSPPPDQSVTGDAICADLGQGTCRTTAAAATGPHCELDFKKRCRPGRNDCPTPGDRCLTTLHGAPLPLVAGGVAVCVVSTFTEDVVGTTNLDTGESAVRIRHSSAIFSGGSLAQPCPVCGGFCSGPANLWGPGVRSLCTSNADCTGGAICIVDAICSWGPNVDRRCRPNGPHGGPTDFHGNPSVDCPPPSSAKLSGPGLDLLFDPLTTSATSLVAAHDCTAPGSARACLGGDHDQRPCAGALDCPGGTCAGQCFCAGQTRPNGCHAACVGGAHDVAPCASDAECDPPNGFCHQADCRPDPSDPDSVQEGRCTVGPAVGSCSSTTFEPCAEDAQCRHPLCPFCDPGETCVFRNQACFVNGTIQRAGAPGIPDRTTASVFCLDPTSQHSVDVVAGLPGPGAVTQHETTLSVGFQP